MDPTSDARVQELPSPVVSVHTAHNHLDLTTHVHHDQQDMDMEQTFQSIGDVESQDRESDGNESNGKESTSASSPSPVPDADNKENRPRSRWLSCLHRKKKDVDTTWNATFYRWGPLLGLGALLFVILSIPASAIILAVSNNTPTDSWRGEVKPNVYLTIFTSIGNKALAFAAAQGVIITWWARALRGTTMQKLHTDWSSGTNVWAAITAGKRTGILALTTICATVILADGVLLQSATSIRDKALNETIPLHIVLSPEIPRNFTGAFMSGAVIVRNLTPDFLTTSHEFLRQDPIAAPFHDCPGECSAKIKAPSLVRTTCETQIVGFINVTHFLESKGASVPSAPSCYDRLVASSDGQVEPGCMFHRIDIMDRLASTKDFETIKVQVLSAEQSLSTKGEGNMIVTNCTYRSAISEYEVSIRQEGSIEVDPRSARFVAWADNAATNTALDTDGRRQSTLAGIGLQCSLKYDSSIIFYFDRQAPDGVEIIGMSDFDETLIIEEPSLPLPRWRDPLPEIEAGFNELAFRTAIRATQVLNETALLEGIDGGLSIHQNVQGTRVDSRAFFVTRWPYFWAASAVQLICVALVAVTFWDYWRLGRVVSFSPLEFAKAFNAPALRPFLSNLDADDMAKGVGEQKIKYGAAVDHGEAEEETDLVRRLVFDDPEKIYKPMDTFSFGH